MRQTLFDYLVLRTKGIMYLMFMIHYFPSSDCPDSDILGANLYQESIDRCRKRHHLQLLTHNDLGDEQDRALPRSRNTPLDSNLEDLQVDEVISILVCTGVYKPGDGTCKHGASASTRGHRDFPNREKLYKPTYTVQDANDAIRLILKQEGLLWKATT